MNAELIKVLCSMGDETIIWKYRARSQRKYRTFIKIEKLPSLIQGFQYNSVVETKTEMP